jgi:hypothetical protein
MLLRSTTRQAFVEQLESSYFGSSNFAVDFGDGTPLIMAVVFIPSRQFRFLIQRATAGVYKFETQECPGIKFMTEEKFQFDDIGSARNRLDRWLDRVKEELISSNPFAREIDDLRTDIEARIADLAEEQNGFFTREEAAALQEKLGRFEERLGELSAKLDGTDGSMETLNQAIGDLKGAVTLVNRGTWYRMTNGRLLRGLKSLASSKEAREFALEDAKKFLLEGPK